MSRCDLSSDIRGGFSRGVPPLPIPNRAVKPARADGTDTPVGRVGRRRASGSPGRLMTSGAPLCICMLVPVPFPAPAQTPARPRLPSVPHTPPSPSVSLAPPSPATEMGVGVARACGAAPLGYGNGRKCSPSVRCGTVGRRIVPEMFPERAARHRWATERDRSVPRACGAAPSGDG